MTDTQVKNRPAEIIRAYGIDNIIDRIANGEMQIEIANELGVSDAILSWHIKSHPMHAQALESHHRRKLDEIDRLHDEAVEHRDFDLARAREAQFKRRYMRASIESRSWATKQDATVTHTHQLEIDLSDLARRVAYLSSLQTVDISDAALPQLENPST